jgi:hypothetical protein
MTAVVNSSAKIAGTITGLRHRIIRKRTGWPDTITETEMTFTRSDGKDITVRSVSMWRLGQHDLIRN